MMTNYNLRDEHLESMQVLVHNQVDRLSEGRHLVPFSPEACDRVADHRVHKIDGRLYWQVLLDGNDGH